MRRVTRAETRRLALDGARRWPQPVRPAAAPSQQQHASGAFPKARPLSYPAAAPTRLPLPPAPGSSARQVQATIERRLELNYSRTAYSCLRRYHRHQVATNCPEPVGNNREKAEDLASVVEALRPPVGGVVDVESRPQSKSKSGSSQR